MNSQLPALVEIQISAHRAAVQQDEGSFTADGLAICDATANATQAVEISAFKAFVVAPCKTFTDIQAKVDYLLHGTVGERDELADLLLADEYQHEGRENLLRLFLRSLLIDPM